MTGMVCIPEWVVDEVLPHRRQACWALVTAMFRFGTERMVEGELRVYLAVPKGKDWRRGPMTLMGRTWLSRSTLFRAIDELQALGLLHRHVATRATAADGLSFPVLRPMGWGVKMTPLADSGGSQNDTPTRATIDRSDGGGDHDPTLIEFRDLSTTTTTNPRAPELAEELASLGFTNPDGVVARHGVELVERALDQLAAVAPRRAYEADGWTAARLERGGVRNAPGLVTLWLSQPAMYLGWSRPAASAGPGFETHVAAGLAERLSEARGRAREHAFVGIGNGQDICGECGWERADHEPAAFEVAR